MCVITCHYLKPTSTWNWIHLLNKQFTNFKWQSSSSSAQRLQELHLPFEIQYFNMHVATQEWRSCDLLSRGEDLNSQGHKNQMHHWHFNEDDYVMCHKDCDWVHYNLCMAWCKPLSNGCRWHTVCWV